MQKNPFTLNYKKGQITIAQHTVGGATIYKVDFSDGRVPLVLTRALNPEHENWWTSIPEGRLPEAREIGPLIEEFIRTNP